MTDSDTGGVVQQQGGNGKLLGGCTGKGFLPGQSGNPNGRAKGTGFYDALRAYAEEKPEAGDDATRFAGVLRVLFKRAMEGSSRHTQLILDRLVPHKSIKVVEDTRTVHITMTTATPPQQWTQPILDVTNDGQAKLIESKSSEDAEDE